jgi:hypothetical protein
MAPRKPTSNAEAIEVTIKSLDLDASYAALVQFARSLARTLDAEDNEANLAREYRQVLDMLMKAGAGGADDDAAAFLARIQVQSKVRNPKKS